MSNITTTYAKDLDLNLLRAFVVVAEEGSITRAAARLYVTQPAISGSMRRLANFVGEELFADRAAGLALTHRGSELLAIARAHLAPLVAGVVAGPAFDPTTTTAMVRFGIDDGLDSVVLPPLFKRLRATAPRLKVAVVSVNCLDVEEALLTGKAALALSVADAPPRAISSEQLLDDHGAMGFVCLYDGRVARLPRAPTVAQYFAQEHVAVSYSGDGRGIVEDVVGRARDIRLSLPGFSGIGEVLDGSKLIATVPALFAAHMQTARPHFRMAKLPFPLPGSRVDLLWSRVAASDPAADFLLGEVRAVVTGLDVHVRRAVVRSKQAGRDGKSNEDADERCR